LVDFPDDNFIRVELKNFYETHAPNKTKIFARGQYKYPYDNFWKHYGFNYTKLDQNDRVSALSIISKSFELEVFDKALTTDDNERYEVNAIQYFAPEIAAFHRYYLGEKYKFPLTLSYVGLKGEPLGIKATLYNYNEMTDQGSFFHINPSYWAKKPEDIKKKKSSKVASLPLLDDFQIEYVLKKGGWDILFNSLMID